MSEKKVCKNCVLMNRCKHSPDENKQCSCLMRRKAGWFCDVYDELINDLKQCPLTEANDG